MKDHVEVGHLSKNDAFRVNRDQVMDLEIRFKIHTNRGYYTVARRYEFYFRVAKQYFTNERSE